MKRTICLIFTLVVVLSTSAALGNGNRVQRVPAGAVAWHFVANLTFGPTGPELVGYIAFIEGVRGPFFNGTPGVETAFFTVRVQPETFLDLVPLPVEADLIDDEVNAFLIPPGLRFDVYLNDIPNQDWGDPESFSDGKRVATFEESALLSTGIVNAAMGYNLFSSDLISSKRFRFHGQRVDFKRLVPNGVTINNFTSPFTSGFTGSAIAIGGDNDD